MTVVAVNSFSGPYSGNGATTAFPFTFKALDATEVKVLVDGVEISSGLYTVSLNAGGNGGTVTMLAAPLTGVALVIASNPSFAQQVDFTNAGPFLAESHDEANDHAAVRAIYLKAAVERSLRVPEGETLDPLPADRANFYLAFDNNGQPVGVPAVASVQGLVVDPGGPPFNARSDGTNALSAVQAALDYAFAAGLPVDGGDKEFAVSGNLVVTGLTGPHIRSLNLKQLSPGASRVTLAFTTCQAVRIDRLNINVGSSATLGSMTSSFGLHINGGSDHRIANVEVFGSGKNSLIYILGVSDSRFDRLVARDAVFSDAAATDDVMQGIWLNNCTDCKLNSPKVHDLTGNALYLGVPFANLRTRGIILSGCEAVTITDPDVRNVDQAIDVTGSSGNRKIIIIGGTSRNCGSVGIKFANSAVYCKAIGHTAENIGFHGFLASGPAEAGLTFKTQDCEFIACTSINAGYNGITFPDKSGFMVRPGDFDADFPKGIRFIGCTAMDNQTVKTMKYGFYNEGIAYDTVAKRPNEVIDGKSIGHTTNAQANFHRSVCHIGSSAGNLTVTTGSAVDLTWDNESSPFEDSKAMHAASAAGIVVDAKGIYEVTALVPWNPSNTTGYRRAYLFKDAVEVMRDDQSGSATVNSYNRIRQFVEVNAGQTLKIRVEHTAGVDATVARGGAFFRVELVREI